jgi:GntR family transcriptional regulator
VWWYTKGGDTVPLWETWSKTFDDRLPIYRQIILEFSRAFVRGDIAPGQRIPSIRELSAVLKVNTNTIQRVYQEMERSGLIQSKRGTGYFFTEEMSMTEQTRQDLTAESMHRFVQEMRALGCTDSQIITEVTSYMEGGESDESGS